ncbi:MAG: helix-turn-helix domain-containing protein [Thermoprotei archaeon]
MVGRTFGGKELEPHSVLGFIYGLSESDVRVLHYLMETRKKATIDELSSELKVSKASISKSLKSLYEKGLVKKDKVTEKENKKGRPSYVYWVEVEELYAKVINDLEEVVSALKTEMMYHFKMTAVGGNGSTKEVKAVS